MPEEQESLQNEAKSKKFKTFYEHYSIVALSSLLSGAIDMKNYKLAKYYNRVLYILPFYLMTFFGMFIYSIYVNVRFKNNITDALKQLSVLNIIFLSIIKAFIRIFHKKDMNEILKAVDKDYEDANKLEEEHQKVMEKSIRDSKYAERLLVFQCSLVVVFISSKPLYDMMKSALTDNTFTRQMILEVEVPFINEIKMRSPIYEILALYIFTEVTNMTSVFTSFDPIFLMLIIHSCANLEIVKTLLRDLFTLESGEYDTARVRLKMKRIVILHQKIIKYIDVTQIIYWPFIFLKFFTSTLLLCATMYLLVSSLENDEVQYEIIGLFLAPLLNIYVLSFYGEKLIEKSQEVGNVAYSCGWENYPDSSVRKSVSLIIMRSQHPLQFSSKFSHLSMASFSTILQTAWSYYTLMRRAGKD